MSRPITIYGREVPSAITNRINKDVIDILYANLTKEEKELLKALSYIFIRVMNKRERRKINTTEFIHFVKEYISIK